MSAHLFIGGCKDGCHLHLSDNAPYVQVPVPEHNAGIRVQTYHLHWFRTGPDAQALYIVEGMTQTTAFQRLLDNYKPTP